jgi:hypothetical protein
MFELPHRAVKTATFLQFLVPTRNTDYFFHFTVHVLLITVILLRIYGDLRLNITKTVVAFFHTNSILHQQNTTD